MNKEKKKLLYLEKDVTDFWQMWHFQELLHVSPEMLLSKMLHLPWFKCVKKITFSLTLKRRWQRSCSEIPKHQFCFLSLNVLIALLGYMCFVKFFLNGDVSLCLSYGGQRFSWIYYLCLKATVVEVFQVCSTGSSLVLLLCFFCVQDTLSNKFQTYGRYISPILHLSAML